ncbi:hypothetical protein TTHERM_00537040 (macronuclear) [Tetrahymena thermophila SB210]|uniref:Uncharacterized protein n=1 Tax=Tetrahymena thermophila (strain SB210) TaxID=312017 RepID=I7M3J7_TETTS|nr:hypothetical protein TTHERM_00537040 [Tetrahymena thermophila SB210]EAS03269.2 hypothetical protein TTHERM_00537040 [Tetrahymena thermophila SB210]|eukprot:XP_001023514.2 hypothetical protein TTHERM_00537040 [Tetrahymena thermophila SB210]
MNDINKILDNQAKPKSHFNQYSLDEIEDKYMKDVVISSKPNYEYEEMYLCKLEQGKKTYEQCIKGAIPKSKFDKILERKEPLDNDLNYTKVEKLKKQYIYEYIESQTHSFQKQQQDIKVFQKKNKKLNFFFSDADTIEEIGIDAAYHNVIQEQTSQGQQDNELNDPLEQSQKFKLKAKVDAHSQGNKLFFVYKDQEYKLEREIPGNVFIEVRRGDMVGIFKKDDFNYIPIDLEQQQQAQQQQAINKMQSSISSNNQVVMESKHLITEQQDDRSEISTRSKAYSISSHHTNHLQYRKKNQYNKKVTNNYLNVTPNKQFGSSKNISYLSTASQKRY